MTLTHSDSDSGLKSTELYSESICGYSVSQKIRSKVRDLTVEFLSINKHIDRSVSCIQFPYYHHVYADEVKDFERQLNYLKNYGDFISIDHAVEILHSKSPINGRYFCLTFDDGQLCCYKYALPVLAKLSIPGTFYIVTEFVGKSFTPDSKITRDVFGYRGIKTTLDFMSWDQCREALSADITIGSHSVSHTRLSVLTDNEVNFELLGSKNKIEDNIGRQCIHFCAPYGIPSRDFNIITHGRLARDIGYISFATGSRGINELGDSPLELRRDHLLASWSNNQLKYFLAKP